MLGTIFNLMCWWYDSDFDSSGEADCSCCQLRLLLQAHQYLQHRRNTQRISKVRVQGLGTTLQSCVLPFEIDCQLSSLFPNQMTLFAPLSPSWSYGRNYSKGIGLALLMLFLVSGVEGELYLENIPGRYFLEKGYSSFCASLLELSAHKQDITASRIVLGVNQLHWNGMKGCTGNLELVQAEPLDERNTGSFVAGQSTAIGPDFECNGTKISFFDFFTPRRNYMERVGESEFQFEEGVTYVRIISHTEEFCIYRRKIRWEMDSFECNKYFYPKITQVVFNVLSLLVGGITSLVIAKWKQKEKERRQGHQTIPMPLQFVLFICFSLRWMVETTCVMIRTFGTGANTTPVLTQNNRYLIYP